jgi:two-component system chemotaxis sensor kinase CheA
MDLLQKLLAAFEVEYKEILQRIRSNLALIEEAQGPIEPKWLEEAFRMAHSLKGAARVVDYDEVMNMAHELETLFAKARKGEVKLDSVNLRNIHSTLILIENSIAVARGEKPSNANSMIKTPPPLIAEPIQSLRLNATHLDQILASTGELLTTRRNLNETSKQLVQTSRIIQSMQAELSTFKKVNSSQLHDITLTPEMNGVSQYLHSIERELRLLSRQVRQVGTNHQRNSWELRRMSEQLQEEVQHVRMVPAHGVFEGFHKMTNDLATDTHKKVEFRSIGLEIEADRAVLQSLKDSVMHLLRNAIAHGVEAPSDRLKAGKPEIAHITFRIESNRSLLKISIEDDGKGINYERIKQKAIQEKLITAEEAPALNNDQLSELMFHPGFSTAPEVSHISGRGMGLSEVQETVKRLRGQIEIVSTPGQNTTFVLSVPIRLSAHRVLIIGLGNQIFGIPSYGIERVLKIEKDELQILNGKLVFFLQDKPLPFIGLAELIGTSDGTIQMSGTGGKTLSLIILKSGGRRLALAVDNFLNERETLIQDLQSVALANLIYINGVMNLEDGTACIVLNPNELVESSKDKVPLSNFRVEKLNAEATQKRILVVDDSITTRTLEKSILEAKNFHVTLAVDGVNALELLTLETFDLIISDVEMPRMNGFTLLQEIKKNPKLSQIPVIMMTSVSNISDQERGLNLGAQAYLIKQKFDQKALIETIGQIL